MPIGVVELEEPESAPLGMAGGFARTADGRFLVSDRQRGTLLVHGPDGRREAEIGRRGSGPGEWASGPFRIFPFDDSTVAVSDGGLLKVFPIERPENAWIRTQSPTTPAFSARGGTVLARRINRDHRATMMRFRGPADSAELGGPFPSQLGRSRTVDMMLVFVAATPLVADSFAVFTQGSDFLFIGPFAGPYDSLYLPPVTRRGAMAEILGAVRDEDPESAMKAAYQASYPLDVQRLGSPGVVAVLTIDQEFLGNRMAGTLHLSAANLRTRVACGEVRVPVYSDPQPWAVIGGDTLFVFSHETDTLSARTALRVRKFRVDREAC
ncbi:MAG: hypothetical protein KF709_12935 [Gemmatimonadaceae bacterium]|nr:hypothetical protein [Gemmatimonadaceae bacterium]